MRERTIIVVGLVMFCAVVLSLFFVTRHINQLEQEFRDKYKSPSEVYQSQIDEIGSKKELEVLLRDSLAVWREKDREMLANHLEELQFYIDEYNDIRTMPKEKVDKVYRAALEELVRKYRSNELKPTE